MGRAAAVKPSLGREIKWAVSAGRGRPIYGHADLISAGAVAGSHALTDIFRQGAAINAPTDSRMLIVKC